MFLTHGALANEPTYSLGVAPLVQAPQGDTTAPAAASADRPGFFGER